MQPVVRTSLCVYPYFIFVLMFILYVTNTWSGPTEIDQSRFLALFIYSFIDSFIYLLQELYRSEYRALPNGSSAGVFHPA